MDMACNMGLAAQNSFPNSTMVIDRFRVVRLVMDAMQHIRVIFRWKAIAQENTAIKKAKEKKRMVLSRNTSKRRYEYHLDNILNFFDNRSTNANAESFNSKIKGFAANLRGVTDVKFFLFRLEKLFAIELLHRK